MPGSLTSAGSAKSVRKAADRHRVATEFYSPPFTLLEIPDLRLAAWFLWITPLLAARSSNLAAWLAAVLAVSMSFAAIAASTFLIAVLTSDLTALLRSLAFSLVIIRFF